jgi:hypothetical protein
MEKVTVELEISKTEKDFIDALSQLIAGIKGKKSISELIALEVPNFITLSSEFGNLGPDFAASDKVALVAYMALSIEKAIA